MFKFRKSATTGRDADSVETIRRRAQYRLVGTAMLVAVAIVGFPLLFDTEPRPLQVDLPIAIPSKDEVQPLPVPSVTKPVAVAQAAAPAAVDEAPATKPVATAPAAGAGEDAAAALKAQEQAAKAQKAEQARQQALAVKQAEAARAQAILDGTRAKAAASATDYPNDGKRRVIQVGSFNDQARAREVRMRLERAGITTYTQVVNSGGSRFIRVRVGPFDDAEELQRYIDKVESLKLEARVLTF
ncbi:SPOR domain-containing protein [Comamonadaceae bacterium M7527]|nr:SPOR domain-containing protein [Comamonadaceae bacterium M7527]